MEIGGVELPLSSLITRALLQEAAASCESAVITPGWVALTWMSRPEVGGWYKYLHKPWVCHTGGLILALPVSLSTGEERQRQRGRKRHNHDLPGLQQHGLFHYPERRLCPAAAHAPRRSCWLPPRHQSHHQHGAARYLPHTKFHWSKIIFFFLSLLLFFFILNRFLFAQMLHRLSTSEDSDK